MGDSKKSGGDLLLEDRALVGSSLRHLSAGFYFQDYAMGEHDWSDEYFLMLGLSPQSFVVNNESFLARMHPDDIPECIRRASEAHNSGAEVDQYSLEFRLRHADGRYRWLRTHSRLERNADGKVVRESGLAYDVSLEHELRGRLMNAERQRALGIFAGEIAHDFNNVLTVIMGEAEIMGLDASLSPEIRASLNAIHRTAERAGTMTSRLLAFSRTRGGEPRVVDLNVLLTEFERTLQHVIDGRYALNVEPCAIPIPVAIDVPQIEQLLLNLVINARDAMPQGGPILVRCYVQDNVLSPDGQTSASRAILAVEDRGPGVPDELRPRIFEPFFTTKSTGTGLGLASCREIAERAHGTLDVRNKETGGSEFFVTLPLNDVIALREPGGVHQTKENRPVPAARVLVVDGDEAIRDTTVRGLVGLAFRAEQCVDLRETLNTLERKDQDFDVLIADPWSLGEDARMLCEETRARCPHLLIVFVSGHPEPQIFHQLSLDYDVNFLAKPYTPATLARRVRQLLLSR